MVYPSVGVISIKLQNSFVEIAFIHGFLPVGLLDVCGAFFLENTSGELLVNTGSLIYDFLFIPFNELYF